MGKNKKLKRASTVTPPVPGLCGARTRAGPPCRRPAGWGTDHVGEGRCKLHAGCSPGGPVGNKKAERHGLTSGEFRGYFQRAKKACLEALRRAAANQDPLKAQDIADTLAVDARRLLAGVLMVEKRCAELEAQGKLDAKAQDRAHRALTDYERLLAKVRAAQVNLVNHFGVGGDETQEITVHLALPRGTPSFSFAAGAKAELPEGDVPAALPAPENDVVEVEGGKVER